VDPLNVSKIFREETVQNYLLFLKLPIQLLIEYNTPKGKVGYDAGGLTKDFYDLMSKELQKHKRMVDDYFIPNDIYNHKEMWYMYGIFFGRSIFVENISPCFFLHPAICFFMIYGFENINLIEFLNIMSMYEIEYFTNLMKIVKMSKSEYSDFLEMQDQTFCVKKKYIQNILVEKYLSTTVRNFIQGFRDTVENIQGYQHVRLYNFISFVHGQSSYPIYGHHEASLEKNLIVINKVKTVNTKQFRQKMLRTLSEMDHEKQRKFFKFWFGNSSLTTFNLGDNPCLIISDHSNFFGCFQSSTCFNQLKMNSKDTRGDLLSIIEATIQNQDLNESVGMMMQFE
jgi:hypothetical protein